jgi:hypothetical protein
VRLRIYPFSAVPTVLELGFFLRRATRLVSPSTDLHLEKVELPLDPTRENSECPSTSFSFLNIGGDSAQHASLSASLLA